MLFVQYTSWIENYLEYDNFWFDRNLPWEDTSFLWSVNVFLFDVVFNEINNPHTFPKEYFCVVSNYALLVMYIKDTLIEVAYLHRAFFFDTYSLINVYFFQINHYYWVSYRDYVTIILHTHPELLIPFSYFYRDYIAYYSIDFEVSILNEALFNNTGFTVLDFLSYWKWVILSTVAMFLVLDVIRNGSNSRNTNFFTSKVYIYFYSLSRENRIQFELMIQFFYYFLLCWVFSLMSYNDSNVEFIELMHTTVFYFFLFLISYLIYKYSIHYFSFLEASFTEGKSASFFSKQFVRDISNTFALFLRFFLLLFRLNIYDCLDDFLDSYYIFFCDFDDDTYYDELLIPGFSSLNFYLPDNHTDANIFNDIETDLVEDLFQKYYITWGKLYMFWFFILEESFRVSLALYITYLIIFEVHSINASFSEETFFKIKRFSSKF